LSARLIASHPYKGSRMSDDDFPEISRQLLKQLNSIQAGIRWALSAALTGWNEEAATLPDLVHRYEVAIQPHIPNLKPVEAPVVQCGDYVEPTAHEVLLEVGKVLALMLPPKIKEVQDSSENATPEERCFRIREALKDYGCPFEDWKRLRACHKQELRFWRERQRQPGDSGESRTVAADEVEGVHASQIQASESRAATPPPSEQPAKVVEDDGPDPPDPVAVSISERVKLFSRDDPPIVGGEMKDTLTNAQYDVVLALLNAGDAGLTKDNLDRESKHGDARKILRRLADNDCDWRAVISFPGTTGKGYRIL
jgi:hypothetical protein